MCRGQTGRGQTGRDTVYTETGGVNMATTRRGSQDQLEEIRVRVSDVVSCIYIPLEAARVAYSAS